MSNRQWAFPRGKIKGKAKEVVAAPPSAHQQAEGNSYNPDVFQGLMQLADKFEADQCFSAAEELRAMALRGPDPFGWYCELVHVESGEVVSTNFFRDGPITGKTKLDGFEWHATAVYALPRPIPCR